MTMQRWAVTVFVFLLKQVVFMPPSTATKVVALLIQAPETVKAKAREELPAHAFVYLNKWDKDRRNVL